MTRASREFRATLKRELDGWLAQGWIAPDGARALAAQYKLDEASGAQAATVIYAIGALLVGGGVISFVAWNWSAMGAAAKLLLVGGALAAAHAGGATMIARDRGRLGHGLILLGSLICGANLGLWAQTFNLGSSWYLGAFGWALGALAAAAVLRNTASGMLAAVAGAAAGMGWIAHGTAGIGGALAAIAIASLLLPIAVREGSRALAAIAIIAAAATFAAWGAAQCDDAPGAVAALLALVPLLIGVGRAAIDHDAPPVLAPAAPIGLALLVAIAYLASFGKIAHELSGSEITRGLWLVVLFALPAAGGFFFAFRTPHADPIAIGAAASATALLVALPLDLAPVVVANFVLLGLAAASIARSVNTLSRRSLYGGVGLALAVIVSRFLELETGLLAKAAVFTASGLLVIAAGATFERRIRTAGSS